MATWSGWVAQFLQTANILNTPPNQRFLNNWASHATSTKCASNPIDLTETMPQSANCAANTGVRAHTQRYVDHSSGAHAFAFQIQLGEFAAIRSALNSGNPFQVDNSQDVASALVSWGSVRFANWYLDQVAGSTSSGGGTGAVAPNTHKAWGDLQRSLNKTMNSALRDSRNLRHQALRDLRRARKVRH